ncbi:thioredoxin [Marinicrinis sediminis]|uniref:Thioredoxin n=1 Tax=Marinicrinis sediminis TaxID=1652465 RepID=A0ABW5R7Q5_9BACL
MITGGFAHPYHHTKKEWLSMAAKALTTETFNQEVSEGVALVDFWAPWCGPCKVQLPIVEELAGELEGKATIAKVNVDDNGDLAAQYGISSIPTLLLFKDGELAETMVGLKNKAELSDKLNRLMQA